MAACVAAANACCKAVPAVPAVPAVQHVDVVGTDAVAALAVVPAEAVASWQPEYAVVDKVVVWAWAWMVEDVEVGVAVVLVSVSDLVATSLVIAVEVVEVAVVVVQGCEQLCRFLARACLSLLPCHCSVSHQRLLTACWRAGALAETGSCSWGALSPATAACMSTRAQPTSHT